MSGGGDGAPATDLRALHERAWRDPSHWNHGMLGIGGFYFAKEDDRFWVPKANPWLGWTVNLAHPLAPIVFVGVLGACAVAAAALGSTRVAEGLGRRRRPQ